MRTPVHYEVYTVLITAFLLIAFLFFGIQILLFGSSRRRSLLLSLTSSAFLIILLNVHAASWTSYPPLTALNTGSLSFEQYERLLLFVQGSLLLIEILILFRWFALRRKQQQL
jgi:hypothetical protein